MGSTELANRLQALADEAGPTDLGTCLTTVIGARKNDRMEELANVMIQFTIDTVGDLTKNDAVKRAMFQEILRDSLMKAMERNESKG